MYRMKKFTVGNQTQNFIMQNENGPCPLLAVANILLLENKISIHHDYAYFEHAELLSLVTGHLLSLSRPSFNSENWEQNVTDAVNIVPTLDAGLDVNVRFDGILGFEFTQHLSLFDILGIQLVHGWMYDPRNEDYKMNIGPLTYNQAMEIMVEYNSALSDFSSGEKSETEVDGVAKILYKGAIVDEFLQSTASQLTLYGIQMLRSELLEGRHAVFFRNNHFNVIRRINGHIFILVTDQGYQDESRIIWERLDNVEGDNPLFDGNLVLFDPLVSPPATAEPVENHASLLGDDVGGIVTQERIDEQLRILEQLKQSQSQGHNQNMAQPNHSLIGTPLQSPTRSHPPSPFHPPSPGSTGPADQ